MEHNLEGKTSEKDRVCPKKAQFANLRKTTNKVLNIGHLRDPWLLSFRRYAAPKYAMFFSIFYLFLKLVFIHFVFLHVCLNLNASLKDISVHSICKSINNQQNIFWVPVGWYPDNGCNSILIMFRQVSTSFDTILA